MKCSHRVQRYAIKRYFLLNYMLSVSQTLGVFPHVKTMEKPLSYIKRV